MIFKNLYRSLTAQFLMIFIGGTILTAFLIFTLSEFERRDVVSQNRYKRIAEKVEVAYLIMESVPKELRVKEAIILNETNISIDFPKTNIIPIKEQTNKQDLLQEALQKTLKNSSNIYSEEIDPSECQKNHNSDGIKKANFSCLSIYTSLSDNTPIHFKVKLREIKPSTLSNRFILNTSIFLIVIFFLALYASYIATKPLRLLAKAAKDFGNNIETESLIENKGPYEVREAAKAFNAMQSSIKSYVEERVFMLAAITHDLQTPLTRLRLRLEKVSDEELKSKLIEDLSSTQKMIQEGLVFFRSINISEPFKKIDLNSLLESICEDAKEAGHDVSYHSEIKNSMLGNVEALRRSITNIIDNAVKYGKFAHVSGKEEGRKAIITITDGGKGIPENQMETVFEPFKRLENSRSRDSGGTGLGLTIARIIALKHGGNIKLSNANEKDLGLVVTITLPLAN
jgi:signal transduction histidine kinase